SHKVQREFPAIRKRYWGCRFWGRGYFSTTNGAITEDIVLQYLENHIAERRGLEAYCKVSRSLRYCSRINTNL
ncbi:transposase, partial [Blastomonas sp.]|uniref:transposase n=1 Tax=Blastomonas sp. TaxID=1909299 RepID=UPI003593D998